MPKCRFISVSVNSGQTQDLYARPILREGHAKFLYDFDACMHFYNQFVYYYHADVHDGQWNDGGQVVAVGGAGHEGK